MKRILFILATGVATFFALSACGTQYQAQAQQPVTSRPSLTATPVPTSTDIPTATIDYQMTAVIAQQTSDEARRVNAIITAEFEQRVFEQLQLTAQYEQRVQEIYQWTAMAAITTIPLTATQQAIVNAQIPTQQALIISQMSATADAPTQIVAMNNARNQLQFGKISYVVSIFATAALGLLMLCGVVWLIRNPVAARIEEIENEPKTTEAPVTRIDVYKNNGANSKSYSIPCTSEQLSELAENITQGKKTLAINQWEGKDTLLTRPVILRVRAWLRENSFVSIAPDGQLVPSDELLNFLCAWLDRGVLPADYKFETSHSPDNDASPNHAEIPTIQTIPMRNHSHESVGEVV